MFREKTEWPCFRSAIPILSREVVERMDGIKHKGRFIIFAIYFAVSITRPHRSRLSIQKVSLEIHRVRFVPEEDLQ